jgi:hypothetical protein
METSERRLFLQRMAVGVAGGLGGLIHQALAADPKSVRQGISRITGDVKVNGKPAHEGTLINRGDTITTGAGAEAVFVLGDNAFFQRANSRTDFGKTGDAAAVFMRVVTGGLLSVFGKGRREIATVTATLGIRGTGCYIEAEEHRTYFCLCFGAVEVRPLNGQPVRYKTVHHERPLWIENGKTSPAMVTNHTDAEVIMLEALVGRGSPFPAGMSSY